MTCVIARQSGHMLPFILSARTISEWVASAAAGQRLTWAHQSRLIGSGPVREARETVQAHEAEGFISCVQQRGEAGLFHHIIERTSRPWAAPLLISPHIREALSADAGEIITLIEAAADLGKRMPKIAQISAITGWGVGRVIDALKACEDSGVLRIMAYYGRFGAQWRVAIIADTGARTAPPPEGEGYRLDCRGRMAGPAKGSEERI